MRPFDRLPARMSALLAGVALLVIVACGTAKNDKTTAEPAAAAENAVAAENTKPAGDRFVITTNMGAFTVQLDREKAPLSTENFAQYANSGAYDSTIFHRVISTFMIQGGGFTTDMKQRETRPAILNEAANGLKNTRGTIAMARTNDVNSATSQFFINVKDNDFLNFRDSLDTRNFGYAVFGSVISGMEVVDQIKAVPTGTTPAEGGYPMKDVPVSPVVILSVKPAN